MSESMRHEAETIIRKGALGQQLMHMECDCGWDSDEVMWDPRWDGRPIHDWHDNRATSVHYADAKGVYDAWQRHVHDVPAVDRGHDEETVTAVVANNLNASVGLGPVDPLGAEQPAGGIS